MKKIVVLPGGFHPFHAGHLALYKQALAKFKDADVYMAASNNQKDRPFPFKVKQLLATEVAGIPKNRFVQVSGSPFQPDVITNNYTSTEDALIFIRSDKDRKTGPLPDQIRKSDGKMGYYISYPLGKDPALEPFADHAYIDYLDVVPFAGGMTSATEIRNAWPKLDELDKIELIKGMYPEEEMTVPKVKKISQILDSVLVGKLTEDVDPAIYTRADGSIDYALYSMAHEEEARDKERKEKRKAEKEKEKEAKKNTEFDPDAPLNTRQSASVIKRYCAERGISLDKILTQGSRNQNNLRRLVVMAQTHTKFTQEDADNIKKITKAPKVTITSGGSYLNVHGLVKGSLKETFVDPDQSKQYWNHDAQRDVIGTEIEMPLRDNDRRGRRQGFNEGEERSDIESAAQDWVERVYRDSPDKSRDDLYQALERVSHADLGTQHLDYFMGEPLGINLDNKGHIVRMAMIAVDGFDKEDDRNYVSEVVEDDPTGKEIVKSLAKNTAGGAAIGAIGWLGGGGPLGGPLLLASWTGIGFIVGLVREALKQEGLSYERDQENLAKEYQDVVNDARNTFMTSVPKDKFGVPEGRPSRRDVDGVYEIMTDAIEDSLIKLRGKEIAYQIINGLGDKNDKRRLHMEAVQPITAITYNLASLIDNDIDNIVDKLSQIKKTNESMNKIRGMIKESTDEQKSRSVDLHRKLFELMEEEKNNVVKLRGFGREADKKVVDINKVRAEKERDQERENNYYSEKRTQQENYMNQIQEILFTLHEEFAEMEQLGLMPIDMKDAFENTKKLIDFISDYNPDDDNFPFTESLVEKLHLKTVALKEYFGGWRDTSAPRVLRKQEPESSPKDFWNKVDWSEPSAPRVLRKQEPKTNQFDFWNKIDLSETADYIEEK